MELNREQVNTILKNAPIGADKKKILDGLVMRGYKLEGVDSNAVMQTIQPKKETFIQDIKGDFMGIGQDILSSSQKRAENIKGIRQGLESGEKGNVQAIFQTAGQLAGAGADAIGSVFVGGAKMLVSPKTEKRVQEIATNLGTKVIERPEVQKLVKWYDGLDPNTQDTIDAVGGIASLAAEFVGVGLAKKGTQASVKVAKEGLETIGDVTKAGVKRVGSKIDDVAIATGRVAEDLIPSKQRIINTQVTKALDLSPGDLDKLARSTGNELGVFMADKNLIGVNKATTVKNLEDLFDTSYEQVRNEIGKVKKIYKVSDINNYKTALSEVQKKIKGVVGLDDVNKEVSALLKKSKITLNDVQKAKELVDEHFKLYKVTGDVSDEISKKGLSNIRQDLKQFIEKEVKKNVGSDIKALNNDVMTSKSIIEAVKTRSPKGLTKSNLQIGDLGAFGIGSIYGGPVGGLASVLFKKIVESPTVRLRFAKWLDKLEDVKKLKLQEQFKKGVVPDDVKKVVGL